MKGAVARLLTAGLFVHGILHNMVYAAFLRAVNMAGHNKINMKALADTFINSGYEGARTYIQSGNVVFSLPRKTPPAIVEKDIEGLLAGKFGLSVRAMVRTREELLGLEGRNPYLAENGFDPARMAVIFLDSMAPAENIAKLAGVGFPPDRYMIEDREVFIYCPGGFGRSKINTVFFETKLKVAGTARNWNTIGQITLMTGDY